MTECHLGWIVRQKMRGQFLQEIPETVNEVKTWKWTGKVDLKVITGTLIFAAQEKTLRANYVKFNIDKSVESNLCGQKGKTISHIIGECKYLAQE